MFQTRKKETNKHKQKSVVVVGVSCTRLSFQFLMNEWAVRSDSKTEQNKCCTIDVINLNLFEVSRPVTVAECERALLLFQNYNSWLTYANLPQMIQWFNGSLVQAKTPACRFHHMRKQQVTLKFTRFYYYFLLLILEIKIKNAIGSGKFVHMKSVMAYIHTMHFSSATCTPSRWLLLFSLPFRLCLCVSRFGCTISSQNKMLCEPFCHSMSYGFLLILSDKNMFELLALFTATATAIVVAVAAATVAHFFFFHIIFLHEREKFMRTNESQFDSCEICCNRMVCRINLKSDVVVAVVLLLLWLLSSLSLLIHMRTRSNEMAGEEKKKPHTKQCIDSITV